jgi:glutaredoxin
MSRPQIDVLTFAGCPHARAALALVERLVSELELEASIRRIDVTSLEQAEAQRFLGSPTIRVNGSDIEPGAGKRTGYTLACRIYGTATGVRGEPDENWLRQALLRTTRLAGYTG